MASDPYRGALLTPQNLYLRLIVGDHRAEIVRPVIGIGSLDAVDEHQNVVRFGAPNTDIRESADAAGAIDGNPRHIAENVRHHPRFAVLQGLRIQHGDGTADQPFGNRLARPGGGDHHLIQALTGIVVVGRRFGRGKVAGQQCRRRGREKMHPTHVVFAQGVERPGRGLPCERLAHANGRTPMRHPSRDPMQPQLLSSLRRDSVPKSPLGLGQERHALVGLLACGSAYGASPSQASVGTDGSVAADLSSIRTWVVLAAYSYKDSRRIAPQ